MDKFGVKFAYSPHGEPIAIEGPIKTSEDIKSFNIQKMVSMDDAKTTKYLIDKLGKSKAHVVNIMDPFKVSWYLRGGMDKLLVDLRMTDIEVMRIVANRYADEDKKSHFNTLMKLYPRINRPNEDECNQ